MKKTILALFILAFNFIHLSAQFSKGKSISDQTDSPMFIDTKDIDGDGDLDILSASLGDAKVAWYTNLGNNTFSEQQIISTIENGITSVHAADLDGDGDNDVLITAGYLDMLVWFENDGLGNFSERIILSPLVDFPSRVSTADLDMDGDLDVLSASQSDHKIAWYENDGLGNFSEQKLISNRARAAQSVKAKDLDNDGDLDVLTAARANFEIIWYKNDGNGNFSAPISISTDAWGPRQAYSADLDNDGDYDILSASQQDDKIAWFENDGLGNFSTIKIISTKADYAASVFAADVNGDGLTDVLSASVYDDKIAWYENIGKGQFSEQIIIDNQADGARFVYGSDIDGDGDVDIFAVAQNANQIIFYENLSNYPSIAGKAFWDKNDSGTLDSLETLLTNMPISISPNALSSYTDADGNFRFYVTNGNYIIEPLPDSCWFLTTDSAVYHLQIDNNVALDKNFGFQSASDFQHTQARIHSNPTRCGFSVPFWLSVENDGCLPSRGQVGLVLNEFVTLVVTDPMPDEIRGDTLFWNHEELINSEISQVKLIFEIANASFLGERIQMTALSYVISLTDELVLSSTYPFKSVINCAFDPNDKLVVPDRRDSFELNYTLFEEDLEYTIRFQNTGTDTAFNIIIQDVLDPNLDWNTFKPILASHSFEASLDKTGQISFSFKDILLPDSLVNEPASHGFITYKIAPKPNLAENTVISNTAQIYFDFNEPIITNTVQNVYVSEFPTTTPIKEILPSVDFRVYPNPFDHQIIFENSNQKLLEKYEITLFDNIGRTQQTFEMIKNQLFISLNHLESGLYFYHIKNQNGHIVSNGKIIKINQ